MAPRAALDVDFGIGHAPENLLFTRQDGDVAMEGCRTVARRVLERAEGGLTEKRRRGENDEEESGDAERRAHERECTRPPGARERDPWIALMGLSST